MGRIPADFIETVLANTDIVSLVRPRVSLKRYGQDWIGLCPFHQENTPSFSVSEKKQFFHCFGCQSSGSAVDFIMRYDQLAFPEAMAYLAAQLGMTVPDDSAQTHEDKVQQQRRLRCHRLLEAVADYYQAQLRLSPFARAYLAKRNVSEAAQVAYRIGFSPLGGDLPASLATPANQNDLIETGIWIKNAGRIYPRFKHRIMFPIRNRRGSIIGFGGRSLDPKEPAKYLNSPNTFLFHKGGHCYGLYQAQRAMGGEKTPSLIVVEGYMDVIRLYQHGFPNGVATLGTALTAEQVNLLLRQHVPCFFCFDGDAAGEKAAWRAVTHLLPRMREGMKVRFICLPAKHDPDSFLVHQGTAAFTDLQKQAMHFDDFFFSRIEKLHHLGHAEGKAAFVEQASQHLSHMPNGVYRTLMMQQLAARVALPEQTVSDFMRRSQQAVSPTGVSPAPIPPLNPTTVQSTQHARPTPLPVKRALIFLVHDPGLCQHPLVSPYIDHTVLAQLQASPSPACRLLATLITDLQKQEGDPPSTAQLLTHWRARSEKAHAFLLACATASMILPAAHWAGELKEILIACCRHLQQERIDALLKKAKETGLSAQEKQELQQCLRQKKTL